MRFWHAQLSSCPGNLFFRIERQIFMTKKIHFIESIQRVETVHKQHILSAYVIAASHMSYGYSFKCNELKLRFTKSLLENDIKMNLE